MPKKYKRVYKYNAVEDIVDNDKAFDKWLLKPKNGEKDKKAGSRRNKKYTMRMYIHFLHENGMTDANPTSLITHALAHQKKKNQKFVDAVTPDDFEALILSDDDDIGDYEKLILDFKTHLEGRLKASTAKSNFNRLINFYKFYKVDVSNIDVRINAPVSTKSKKAPDFELLKKAFQTASTRNKCIMSCGVTSGMARLDITTVTYGEFEDGLQTLKDVEGNPLLDSAGNKVEVCVIDRGREKNFNEYHTFFAPETVRWIKKYLEERNNQFHEGDWYETRRIYKKTDKLFIDERIEADFRESIVRDKEGNVIDYDDSLRAFSAEGITKMYVNLRKDMQLPNIEGEYSSIRSHAMRHYFSNNYKSIDADYKEHWMGHAGDKVKVTYEDYNVEEGLQYYLQGLDGVTIEGTVNYTDITHPSVTKMKLHHEEEISDIRAEIEKLKTKDQIRNGIDILQDNTGMEIVNEIDGEEFTSTIDSDNLGLLLLQAFKSKMDADPTWSPSTASEEELDDIFAAVKAERDTKRDPEKLKDDPLIQAVMKKLMAQEE